MTSRSASQPAPVPHYRDRKVDFEGKITSDLDGQTNDNTTALGVGSYRGDEALHGITAIGVNALGIAPPADVSAMVAIGWEAMGDVLADTRSVGIGYKALYEGGTDSVAIGNHVPLSELPATEAVVIGASADVSDNGVSIGFEAKAYGDGGVAVGHSAGAFFDRSVVIGSGGLVDDAADEIVLGNPAHHKWKLGIKKTAGVALDTGHYVEVEIDGVIVKLAIVT